MNYWISYVNGKTIFQAIIFGGVMSQNSIFVLKTFHRGIGIQSSGYEPSHIKDKYQHFDTTPYHFRADLLRYRVTVWHYKNRFCVWQEIPGKYIWLSHHSADMMCHFDGNFDKILYNIHDGSYNGIVERDLSLGATYKSFTTASYWTHFTSCGNTFFCRETARIFTLQINMYSPQSRPLKRHLVCLVENKNFIHSPREEWFGSSINNSTNNWCTKHVTVAFTYCRPMNNTIKTALERRLYVTYGYAFRFLTC